MPLRLEVAVDSTSLISALLGGRALQPLFSSLFRHLTTERTTWEVKRYLPMISARSGVPEPEVLSLFEAFPLTACQSAFYESSIPRATQQVGARDPRDVDILALTYRLGAPLWTADQDLRGVPDVQIVTTEDLFDLIQKSRSG